MDWGIGSGPRRVLCFLLCFGRHGKTGAGAVPTDGCGHDGSRCDLSYGIDPRDSNIRIAPSFPPVEELEQAMKIFAFVSGRPPLEKLQNS